MQKSLIETLVRICKSEATSFKAGKSLLEFCDEYNVGAVTRRRVDFSHGDKQNIRVILSGAVNIDVDAFQGVATSRAHALDFASDEKLYNSRPRANRVAVKALAGSKLILRDGAHSLPPGVNLDIDWRLVVDCVHDTVLVVENWEAFEGLHAVTLDLSVAGEAPLVLFRGSPGAYPQNCVVELLKKLAKPVFAFVDFDPAGLTIAQTFPHFKGLVMPTEDVLGALLQGCRNEGRYRDQLPANQSFLNAATNPDIRRAWRLIRSAGVALPQEYFLRKRVIAPYRHD